MRVIAGTAAALLLVAAAAFAGPASAAGAGTISGQVIDRTAGGGPVGQVDVTLQALAHATGVPAGAPVSTRSDGEGRFAFTGIDTAPIYVLTADFEDVTYASEPFAFAAGETEKAVEIAVYRPTQRTDAVRILQQHVIVTPGAAAGSLEVVEIAIVENAGDRTVIGAQGGAGRETLRIALPDGARDVDVSGALAQDASILPGAIVYGGPLAPGQTQLVLTYTCDRGGATYLLRKQVTVPTASVDVLVADAQLSARAVGLAGPVTVAASGVEYVRFTGRDLGAGTSYAVEIGAAGALGSSGLPIPSPSAALVGLLALAAATAYVLLAPRIRRRRRRREPDGRRPPALPEPDELEEPLLEPEGRA